VRETFDALLDKLAPPETWEAFAVRAGVSSRRIRSLRLGEAVRPHRTTLHKLAEALGCTTARVRAAIEASRR
jgi:transcriptional regulator with XRE-family HTH domain